MARATLALALVAALCVLSSASAGYNLRQSWLDLVVGPASASGNQCCYSAACEADNHCVAATCSNQPASECSNYSCYHCECCPCCGDGEYCYSDTTTPFNHGTCCPNGYKGTDCKTPICKQSCNHGKCSAPNKCTCESGWGGPDCTKAVCDHSCGHGSCTGPNTCTCDKGYSGSDCNTPVCTGGCGHGTCTGPDTCKCDYGWTGPNCSKHLCPEGCVHGVCNGPAECTCDKGWTGTSCDQCIPDPFKFTANNANFTISKAVLGGCTWKAGTNHTVTITGTANDPVTAGAVSWKVYENGAQHFIGSGTRNYFTCNNKGCNPEQPVALKLEQQTFPTKFTLEFSFVMPPANATDQFQLYVFGQDQTHEIDFDLTLSYNYTSSADAPAVAAPGEDLTVGEVAELLEELAEAEVADLKNELERERAEIEAERAELAREAEKLQEERMAQWASKA